jgi:hypothetical protein
MMLNFITKTNTLLNNRLYTNGIGETINFRNYSFLKQIAGYEIWKSTLFRKCRIHDTAAMKRTTFCVNEFGSNHFNFPSAPFS